MSEKIYFYPLWLRFWHILNALMFLCLIFTGLSMQFNGILLRFDLAVTVHNTCGIILSINYLFFFVRNFLDGNWRQYIIERRGFFERLQKQFTYYLFGIFKHEKAPFPVTKERKFNPIQQFTYVLVVYIFVPVIIITGLGLLFPQILIHEILGISGLAMTDILHLFMTFFGTLFLIIHVYFCTIGANISANFKSIINGWHEPHD